MDREHLVPLSKQAVELLLDLKRQSNAAFVFPGTNPVNPISQNTMIFACYRMGYRGRQRVHGFRSLALTWANEAEIYSSDWVEMALSHADEDEVRGAYNSALYLTPRRHMLQDWADIILPVAKPVPQTKGLEHPTSRLAVPARSWRPRSVK